MNSIDRDAGGATPVWSVAQLTYAVKEVLEGTFPEVWVSGEISNYSQPQSGHCYFTLKDERCQMKAVMWRTAAARLKFQLQDGLEVVVRGGVEVYAPRGNYQLIVQQLEPRGVGALELALRQLKSRLAAEGLFDPDRKRPLPPLPRRVAFVTSPTGAAVRDFLEILRRRMPGMDVLVVPVRVQGDQAAAEIAQAVQRVNEMAEKLQVDVIVVGRGGGSLEDLWPFNEEVVARAIYASRLPVVSAVGHEIDVTISDLVADVRASTPSEAAERLAPAREEVAAALDQTERRLSAAWRSHLRTAQAQYETLLARRAFRRPFDLLHDESRRVDELAGRLKRSLAQQVEMHRQQWDYLAARLESLSPLSVLRRGFSITRHDDGRLVRSVTAVQPGDLLITRLATGEISSRVEKTSEHPTEMLSLAQDEAAKSLLPEEAVGRGKDEQPSVKQS